MRATRVGLSDKDLIKKSVSSLGPLHGNRHTVGLVGRTSSALQGPGQKMARHIHHIPTWIRDISFLTSAFAAYISTKVTRTSLCFLDGVGEGIEQISVGNRLWQSPPR